MLLMSEITIAVNAQRLGCCGGLRRPAEAPDWRSWRWAWGPLFTGALMLRPTPRQSPLNFGCGTRPSQQGPARSRAGASRCSQGWFLFCSFSWPTGPTVVRMAVCGFPKLWSRLGLRAPGRVSSPGPVSRPLPARRCMADLMSACAALAGGSEDALTWREGAKGVDPAECLALRAAGSATRFSDTTPENATEIIASVVQVAVLPAIDHRFCSPGAQRARRPRFALFPPTAPAGPASRFPAPRACKGTQLPQLAPATLPPGGPEDREPGLGAAPRASARAPSAFPHRPAAEPRAGGRRAAASPVPFLRPNKSPGWAEDRAPQASSASQGCGPGPR
ncbi:hypothetical protein AAY473_015028 [Plecturocebus cupreus]